MSVRCGKNPRKNKKDGEYQGFLQTENGQPSFEPCVHRHFKAEVVNRDCLTHEEHVDMLAAPKRYPWLGSTNDENSSSCDVNPIKKKHRRMRQESLFNEFAEGFINDMWDVMSPDITDRLIDFLVSEFGMTVEETEDFIDCKASMGKQAKCAKWKLKSNQLLEHKWVNKLTEVFANRTEQYITNLLMSNDSAKVKTLSEKLFNDMCETAGLVCSPKHKKTNIEKTIFILATYLAFWLYDIINNLDEPAKENSLETREGGIQRKDEFNYYKENLEKIKKEDDDKTENLEDGHKVIPQEKSSGEEEELSDKKVPSEKEIPDGKEKAIEEHSPEKEKPVEDKNPAEKDKPAEEEKPIVEEDPSKDELSVHKIRRKEEISDKNIKAEEENLSKEKPAEEKTATEEKKTHEEEKLSGEGNQAEEKKPAEEEKQAEEKKPAEEEKQAEEKKPAEEEKQAEEKKPAEEEKQAEEKKPAEEGKQAEEKKPAEEEKQAEGEKLTVEKTPTKKEEPTVDKILPKEEKPSEEGRSDEGKKQDEIIPDKKKDSDKVAVPIKVDDGPVLLDEESPIDAESLKKSESNKPLSLEDEGSKKADQPVPSISDKQESDEEYVPLSEIPDWDVIDDHIFEDQTGHHRALISDELLSFRSDHMYPLNKYHKYKVTAKTESSLLVEKLNSFTAMEIASEAKGLVLPPKPRPDRIVPISDSPMSLNSAEDWAEDWTDWASNVGKLADEWSQWLETRISDIEKQLVEKDRSSNWKSWKNITQTEALKWRVEKERIKNEGKIWGKKLDL